MTLHPARLLACVAGLALAVSGKASAQTTATAEVLSACYIPLVGVVYRIKAAGLPTACLSKNHVEFSWNQVGPKGDRGEKGDPGVAGNLALAGQACPTGFLVSGFSSTGQIVCKNLAGQGPSDPPPPISYEGFWTLSPAPSTKCGPFDVVTFTVSSASTRLGASGILTFTVRGNFDGGIFGNTPFEASMDLTLNQTSNLFSGTGTFAAPGQASFAATVNGEFRSSTSFVASVDISGSITSIPAGDCHPIHEVVTATRSS